MNAKHLGILSVFLGFFACQTEDDIIAPAAPLPQLTAGTADFSNVVSIGNSLTAGFTDGGLFMAAQENSTPNILAQQFALVGGGSFSQPLMNDNTGGVLAAGNRIIDPRLVFDGSGPAPLEAVIGPVSVTTDIFVNNPTGPFNNMGVPGAKAGHLLFDGYGNPANLGSTANPYFIRMASSPSATMLGDAIAQDPSFFTLWIGNNDVLGYALSGAESNPASEDYDPLTPLTGPVGLGFQETYAQIAGGLASNGSKGIVANIPYVTTIPHFTTVPHNPLSPSNPDFGPQIPTLNAAYAPLNAAFDALGRPERKVVFSETEASPVVIFDESLDNISGDLAAALVAGGLDPLTAGLLGNQYGRSRQATADDLFVLLSQNAIAEVNTDYFNSLVGLGVDPATAGQLSVNGITLPLADKWVLVPSEQDEIIAATDAFNQVISATASQLGLGLVDTNMIMQEVAAGTYVSGNFVPGSNLVLGGVFSLDGVHPTSRGYAIIANEFLKAIDATYGSNFEASGNLVDIGNYPTNYSPLLQ